MSLPPTSSFIAIMELWRKLRFIYPAQPLAGKILKPIAL
jgi:hypothetical protein